MVGKQYFLIAKKVERFQVQVVRMAVREPDVAARPGCCHLLFRYFMRQRPTAEISAADNPRVGHEHGDAVVANNCRISDSIKANIHYVALKGGYQGYIQ